MPLPLFCLFLVVFFAVDLLDSVYSSFEHFFLFFFFLEFHSRGKRHNKQTYTVYIRCHLVISPMESSPKGSTGVRGGMQLEELAVE